MSPLPGRASAALLIRAAEVAVQPWAGERLGSSLEAFREWVGPVTCLLFLCSERLRRSMIPLFHTIAAIAPKLLESPQCVSWLPILDAECQCHAKHHDALYLHRCSESRVFQIRAKTGSSWSPKLCTESKV